MGKKKGRSMSIGKWKREHYRHHKLPMHEPYATRYEGHKMTCRHHKGRMFYPCSFMIFKDREYGDQVFCGIDGRECDGEPIGEES
jgi:hypothetical protein